MTDWGAVAGAVPRRLFVPEVVWADLGPGPWVRVDTNADPARWEEVVALDQPLVTRFEDGERDGEGLATSSVSMPKVVIAFLDRLDPQDHHRVLEIGTGSGWTAALLSARVGAGNVTSVEIDPVVAAGAAERLKASGHLPHLVVADGEAGWPAGAPYDRVHATCAVSRVPRSWVEQTRPGGVIVCPYGPGFGYGQILRLDVLPGGRAVGRFGGSADYMMLRSHRPAGGSARRWARATVGEVAVSETSLDPRAIRQAPVSADLVIATLVPGVVSRFYSDADGATLWVLDAGGPGGSWASVDYEPGRSAFRVEQAGDRRLWDEVEAAYVRWLAWGRPDITRFGMNLTADTERIWLDRPGDEIER
jgi:protein-L-isoaspartate O-methyltransferase